MLDRDNMGRSFAQWKQTLSFPSRLPARTAQVFENCVPIYPEPNSEQNIMGSIVYCIHHKEGCLWSDELRKLKGHLNTCKHDATACTQQCGAMIPRVMMEDHLNTTCPNRRVTCPHCRQTLTAQELETHASVCPLEPVYCENKCGAKVQRRLLSGHQVTDCTKRLVPCHFCAKQFVFDTLQVHQSKCGRVPIPCPNRCDTGTIPREELESHLKKQCSGGLVPCSFHEAGCRFKGPRCTVDAHIEECTSQHLALMCSLVNRQQAQINVLRTALQDVAANHTGTLMWKISDFSAKLAEAKKKEGLELCSSPFYTSHYGYKLMATIFPNGNGSGENSHLSVYIKLLPGDFDALLKWPFCHTVSFTLYDQSNNLDKGCNIVESFIPDPSWKNFQKPSREPDSLGFGFPRFVSHEMLKRRHYIKDDTMFIRIKVDPQKIVAV